MVDSALKTLSIAIVILASCIILTFGFRMARSMNSTSDEYLNESNDTVTDMEIAKYSTYNNKDVSGDEVLLAVDKFQTQLWIKVYLNSLSAENVTFRYFPDTNYSTENVMGQLDYIDPEGTFHGELAYDDNGSIEGITFKEK